MKRHLMKGLLTLCLTGIALHLGAQNSTCIYTPYNKVFPPPYSPGSGANAITNGTFENGNLSSWSTLPNANRVTIASTAYHSSYSAKLISKNTAAGDAFLEQLIPNLLPGTTYSLTCYMKAQTNNTSAYLHVRLNYPAGNYQVLTKAVSVTTTWTKYTHTFTLPTTTNLLQTLVQVLNYRGQNTNLFVDNIELLTPATTGFTFLNNAVPIPPGQPLLEEFKGTASDILSSNRWLVVKKSWGNSNALNNNGVVPENLELLCNGGIRFHGHGDSYTGSTYGATTNLGNGKIRVGACIATKDYYASGKYDVVAKLTPGMVNAFWTFHYIEDATYQSGGIKNSEIDWEFPSNAINGVKTDVVDGMCNGWGGLCNGEGIHSSYQVGLGITDAVSNFHKYSIEWHTGGNGVSPSISWYIDDVLIKQETNPTHIPFRASRFWLGVWFGSLNWIAGGNASLLQFSDRYMEVKSVTITPYYEANDIYENETDPFIGYVTPPSYPVFPCTSLGMRAANTHQENETPEIGNLVAYPIPAHGSLYVSYSNQKQLRKIELVDATGRLISEPIIPASTTQINLNTSNLPNGFYMLRVWDEEGILATRKIAIEQPR